MICSEDMNKGVVSIQDRIEMIYAFFGIIIVLVIQGEHSAFEIFLLLFISKFIFVTLMILFFSYLLEKLIYRLIDVMLPDL